MILNRIKDDKEEEKEKQEEQEEEEEESEEQEEKNETTVKEENDEIEINEEEEKEDYDNHKKRMINSEESYSKKKIKEIKFKIFEFRKKGSLSFIFAVLTLIIIIIFQIKKMKNKKRKKLLQSNIDIIKNETNAQSKAPSNPKEDELNNLYNNIGEVNIIKFFEENLNHKVHFSPFSTNLTHIYINLGFSEKNINNVLNHLGSVLYKADKINTFLHIYMMDADSFSYESMLKIKNMIFKINNNTEIIVYNASQALKDFRIREDCISKFSNDYAKLYAFKVLKNIKKIIFLDIENLMIQKDLSELFNKDMNEIYGRGISDYPLLKYPNNSLEFLNKHLYDKSHYINGGVILVNLELCQKDDFYNKAVELNNGQDFYTKTEEPAQDILNILMKRKIEFFHPKFNKINYYEKPEDKLDETKWYPWVSEFIKLSERNNHFYTKQDLLEADQDPVIIQYSYEKILNKESKKYEEDKSFYANLLGNS